MHLVTDGTGLPLAVTISPGQQHESRSFEETLDAVRIPLPLGGPRHCPQSVAGDQGRSSDGIRTWLRKRDIDGGIPRRANRRTGRKPLDKATYRRRSVMERCNRWIKECRRVDTRYEKLAATRLAMLKLTIIGRYFRRPFSYTP